MRARLLAIVVLVLASPACAGHRHPVQPLPRTYTLPSTWTARGCTPRGDTVAIDREVLVTLRCRDGLRLITYRGGIEREFVAWGEIDK